MLTNLILIAVLGQTADAQWRGAVTSVYGDAQIIRSRVAYRAIHGSGIKAGDHIRINGSGGISFYLPQEHVVYVGDNSRARLSRDADRYELFLEQGEARVTSDSEVRLIVRSKWGHAAIHRGILRLRDQGTESCFLVTSGTAAMFWRGQNQFRLTPGRVLIVDDSSRSYFASQDQAHWQISVGKFQLASAMAAQPPTEVPGQTPAAPDATAPSQATPPPTTPERQPSGAGPPSDDEEVPESRAAAERSREEPPPDAAARRTLTGSATSSLSLGGRRIGGFTLASSGGLFSDANQQTLQGKLTQDAVGLEKDDSFPGNIHLITSENRYGFGAVQLSASEQDQLFGTGNNHAYWSIGQGSLPNAQVFTDFLTGTNAKPTVVPIPHTDAYLIRLDQFGAIDAALDPAAAAQSNTGFAGLLGETPVAPSIVGATAPQDERADFNKQATFALGEFRLTRTGPNGESVELAIRRSDQDRTIVKDLGGNDANDDVTVNSQVAAFDDVPDPRFLPQVPSVKVPAVNAFDSSRNRFSELQWLRKAAVTTLMADQLHDFAQRTGQTRFVVREQNGTRKIIDITGYRK